MHVLRMSICRPLKTSRAMRSTVTTGANSNDAETLDCDVMGSCTQCTLDPWYGYLEPAAGKSIPSMAALPPRNAWDRRSTTCSPVMVRVPGILQPTGHFAGVEGAFAMPAARPLIGPPELDRLSIHSGPHFPAGLSYDCPIRLASCPKGYLAFPNSLGPSPSFPTGRHKLFPLDGKVMDPTGLAAWGSLSPPMADGR
ncbi:hypothetical protein BO78DRAFT_31967 [Aspergillus sclerotiicarbonarius CBS 121057]|uniref:Uncharacterized protein n=1 Tax=Aspergillus sclerotiicarbonarius (strain CBS 121057 / IBT 28362) TaxID=1448318 RepID=A0A319EJR9_ASPSB|nr:hypothetical protein BO78DRAFT_31967 [Aspergillus sclerotiicarbonarius CBS 121057]